MQSTKRDKSKPQRPSKKAQQDSIIGTNDYSIVSKRSVEKLYYPSEPEFLRPFVSKFKRRAPLINRGYWLRMRAVEDAVRRFLQEPSELPKMVVNLGCGYDALPFRTMWQLPELCRNVLFVDVDYPQLIERKVQMMRAHDVFKAYLADEAAPVSLPESITAEIFFRNKNYFAIGCDLHDVHKLHNTLSMTMELMDCQSLFVAEVSITYMNTTDADTIIGWVGDFENARFCLLEQYLPDGAEHPFAQRMLDDFNKGGTPLISIMKYSSLVDQKERFLRRGFSAARVRNLWALWQDSSFLTEHERTLLDKVEPFDEWEELALFAGHYFVLEADTTADAEAEADSFQTENANETIHWVKPDNMNQPARSTGSPRFGAMANSSSAHEPELQTRSTRAIERMSVAATTSISPVLSETHPVVITDLDLGDCARLWTIPYLESKLGKERSVVVHNSTARELSFVSKNFKYETMALPAFLNAASTGKHTYLRALSLDLPAKAPARLDSDFPEIAQDFAFASLLAKTVGEEKIHSSVLRVSGDINMWLHYDVMANVYCQIKGKKRVIVFPPKDVVNLGFRPGATTSDMKIFEGCCEGGKVRAPNDSTPWECTLSSGDVLYIPACWPHATTPCPGDDAISPHPELSIAVNVFFRSLPDNAYAAGRDVYGNRDLACYENGRKTVEQMCKMLDATKDEERAGRVAEMSKIMNGGAGSVASKDKLHKMAEKIRKSMERLPAQLRQFYAARLVDELPSKAGTNAGRDS